MTPMKKEERRVIRAAMRFYRLTRKSIVSWTAYGKAQGELEKACAALAKRSKR